jgi:hypothetical protein
MRRSHEWGPLIVKDLLDRYRMMEMVHMTSQVIAEIRGPTMERRILARQNRTEAAVEKPMKLKGI